MVDESKMSDLISRSARSARALHRILIKARMIAMDDYDRERLVGILDYAELLALDLAAMDKRPEEFREHLRGLGEDYPELAGVIKDYDSGTL